MDNKRRASNKRQMLGVCMVTALARYDIPCKIPAMYVHAITKLLNAALVLTLGPTSSVSK